MRSGRRTKQSTLHGTGSGWYEPRPAPEKPAPKHSQAAKMGHHNAGRGLGDDRFPGHPGKPSKAEMIAARKSYLEKTSPGTTDWFQFMGPTGRINLDLVGYPGGGDIGLFAQEGVRSDRLEIISRIISRVPEPVQKTTRRLFVYKDFLQEGDLPGMAMGSDTETLGFAKSDTIHIFGAGQDLHDNRAYEAKAEYIIHHELAHGMFERLDRELQEFKREAPRKLKGEERRAFNQRQWEDEEKELMALNEWETDRDLKIDSWESDQKRKVYHRDYKRDSTIERKIMEVEEETRKRKLMLERVYKDKRFKIEMKTWEPLMRSMRRDDLEPSRISTMRPNRASPTLHSM